MSRLIILGATGSLGRRVLEQAIAAGHEVTVFVRDPSRLPPSPFRVGEGCGQVRGAGDHCAFRPRMPTGNASPTR